MNITSLRKDDLPERLSRLPKPPKVLHCRGVPLAPLLAGPVLGVVGSRNVSAYGRGVTIELTGALARQGVAIVSGLALGVDSIAHKAALDMHGTTIVVLPCGIETIYPRTHHDLARQILNQGGAVVSEYEGESPALLHNFLERNRLIAGLCDGVLITEAAQRSGSLNTARWALEQGKTVLAVPGNITSPVSVGTNNLIKMGATPVTCPEDIFEALNITPKIEDTPAYYAENEGEEAILTHLRSGVQDGHELLLKSELPIAEFQQHLTMLEIKAVIHPLGNNQWKLK